MASRPLVLLLLLVSRNHNSFNNRINPHTKTNLLTTWTQNNVTTARKYQELTWFWPPVCGTFFRNQWSISWVDRRLHLPQLTLFWPVKQSKSFLDVTTTSIFLTITKSAYQGYIPPVTWLLDILGTTGNETKLLHQFS